MAALAAIGAKRISGQRRTAEMALMGSRRPCASSGGDTRQLIKENNRNSGGGENRNEMANQEMSDKRR